MTTEYIGDSAAPSILILCTTFGLEQSSKGLVRELADALSDCGAKVQVCLIDWTGPVGASPRFETLPNGIEVLSVAPWMISGLGEFVANASKWVGSSFFAVGALQRYFGDRQIDLLLDFSPLVVTAWPIKWAKRHFRCRGYAYLTDFFPFHQSGAGQDIGGKLGFRAGLAIETHLLRHFETVACMSPAGIDYVKRHYALRREQEVYLLRLWGDTRLPAPQDRSELRLSHRLPADRPIILFGGQIAEGRGIEELLAVARQAKMVRPDLVFLFMGKGRLEPLVQARIHAGLDNVILKSPVSRDEYLALVTACDIGVVATVADTGVPSFPSKTIDYLRAGIPIVASVESTTDYSVFVEENGFGVATTAGDPDAFLAALLRVVDDPETRKVMSERGRAALIRHFDVAGAARTLLTQAFRLDSRQPSHSGPPGQT